MSSHIQSALPPTQAEHLARLIASAVREQPRMEELRGELLRIGGSEVCFADYEPDLEKILERGTVWKGYRARMMRGLPCQCHRNSALCWDANRDALRIATGYGLSRDGLWRQHTWCVTVNEQVVIETTTKRTHYCGFVMTVEECEAFLDANG
jgi:hypothetical protein